MVGLASDKFPRQRGFLSASYVAPMDIHPVDIVGDNRRRQVL